jgi:hypothetical protein
VAPVEHVAVPNSILRAIRDIIAPGH